MRVKHLGRIFLLTIFFILGAIGNNVYAQDTTVSDLQNSIRILQDSLTDLKQKFDELTKSYGELKLKYDMLLKEKNQGDEGGTQEKSVPQGVPRGC